MTTSAGRVFPCGQLQIHWRHQVILAQTYGQLASGQPCGQDCRFDIASITKLFTAIALMGQVESGAVNLEDPVYLTLPEVAEPRALCPYEDPLQPGHRVSLTSETSSVDPKQVTWRQLLTHTAGLPPWRPLYACPDSTTARAMALATFFSYPPATQSHYSDIGLIWAGIALEQLAQISLERLITDQILSPLHLSQTGFGPLELREIPVAPTEYCCWRQRRIQGEVHDENAARLGGVAGHAGLFSTASDLAQLGQCLLQGGWPLLKAETLQRMIQPQAAWGEQRRGLGFALRSPHPRASSVALSNRAFGHTGFTGTSLWIDPEWQLVVACVTNSLYYGREHDGIIDFRVALHRAIVDVITGVT